MCGEALTPPEASANECWDCGASWTDEDVNDAGIASQSTHIGAINYAISGGLLPFSKLQIWWGDIYKSSHHIAFQAGY